MPSGNEDAEQINGGVDPLAATDKGLGETKVRVSGDPTSVRWWPKEERALQEECTPYVDQSSNERQAEMRRGRLRATARHRSANFEVCALLERKKKADQWRCRYLARPKFGITSLVRRLARSQEFAPYLDRPSTLARLPWRPPFENRSDVKLRVNNQTAPGLKYNSGISNFPLVQLYWVLQIATDLINHPSQQAALQLVN
ncbi:hypothetical protein B0H17DRAFT_1339066 [Mycena rosella]|uniref:Uncharacterized protein n=1 Tax=Mycena rosella TaxID=1033263 RepID=A0AAD7CD59_MYCRO|nr:hypothetical protein B0H17DRAFT_1339066 [Mycena rosella]